MGLGPREGQVQWKRQQQPAVHSAVDEEGTRRVYRRQQKLSQEGLTFNNRDSYSLN